MSVIAAAIAAPVGAAVGLGAGWLSLLLERVEKLEAEDREDREAYERELAAARLKAAEIADAPVGEEEPWPQETYGWTWLERVLCPLLGAVGFAAFAAHEQFGSGLVIHLLWVAVFVQIVGFDLKHRLILNVITYPSILVALVLSEWSPGLTPTSAVIGAVGVALFFLVQNLVSRGSIGLGDAKLGALVGGVTGAGPTSAHLGAVYAVVAGVFIGGAAAIALLVTRIRKLKDPIPYGPFLCAGAALILYPGP